MAMPEGIPQAAIDEATADLTSWMLEWGWMPGLSEVMVRRVCEDAAGRVLETAAPILAGREQEAVRLLEEALHLRMNGERAPGGTETWATWDRDAEAFMRSLSAPMREDGTRGH